jgi:hypothetical protein
MKHSLCFLACTTHKKMAMHKNSETKLEPEQRRDAAPAPVADITGPAPVCY